MDVASEAGIVEKSGMVFLQWRAVRTGSENIKNIWKKSSICDEIEQIGTNSGFNRPGLLQREIMTT